MDNPFEIIHYGMEPYCERASIDSPFPIKITLKKNNVDCEHCIRKMIKNGIIKEKKNFDKKRTRSRDRSKFKNKDN